LNQCWLGLLQHPGSNLIAFQVTEPSEIGTMIHIGTCLCVSIVLQLGVAQPLPPEVDFSDDDMFFCEGPEEDCEARASGEDIDNPSDWLGPHLLQTDIRLQNIKEVRISGDADVEQHAAVQTHEKHRELPQMQITGEADITPPQQSAPTEHSAQRFAEQPEEETPITFHASAQPAWESIPQLILKTEMQPNRPTWTQRMRTLRGPIVLCSVVVLMFVISVWSIRTFYLKVFGMSAQYGLSTETTMTSAGQSLEKGREEVATERKKLLEDKVSSLSYGTEDVAGKTAATHNSPEWTTMSTSMQSVHCPAALRSSEEPVWTAAHETSMQRQLSAMNKQEHLFSTCARFVLPPQSLDRVGSGNWHATGMSGTDFLQMSIRDVPETGHSSLAMAVCGESGDFKNTWKFNKSPLIGTLAIIGSQGELCGTLEPIPGGRCLVKRMGKVAMLLDIGNHVDLCANASDPTGRQLAFSAKNTQAGFSTAEGGETWKVKCKPDADPIFIAGCMLAFMLLGVGVGAGTPAFSKLDK